MSSLSSRPPAGPRANSPPSSTLDHVPPHPSGLDVGPDERPPSAAHTEPAETTALLRGFMAVGEHVHEGPCDHGTFSPRPMSPAHSLASRRAGRHGSMASTADGPPDSAVPLLDGLVTKVSAHSLRGWRKRWASSLKSRKRSTSTALAEQHGVADSWAMYLAYYFPVFQWAGEYRWSYLQGDFIAALTIAGMYLPMALSLADNLAHVPPISGLLAFVFSPLVYALLGSCPAMVVGPEAAGSLLVGTVVKLSVERGRGTEDDSMLHARICGVVAGMAGATVFLAGVARLGFLDSVLSRPFLRGFISAIGVVIAVEQLVPELGLSRLAEQTPGVSHGSSVDKLRFVFSNLGHVHRLTFGLALASFATIMVCREVKRRLQPGYPAVAYVPDRFLVVALSALLTWYFAWDQAGVAVLGEVKSASGTLFTFRWPFRLSHMTHIRDALGTSFLIALLGFFESSVAAKSLGGQGAAEPFSSMQLSANRELVALGVANLVGACFMSLPAFGGYGRSKVNKSTGGKSPMSSILLSLLALVCIFFVLPYFYYLPKPVLASMITVVAWSLIEECPSDVSFFLRIRAWPELGLMLVIVLVTIFFSLTLGIATGVGLSLLQVIRHSTRPRIQILGRVPGTHRFQNAELAAEGAGLEFFEGCLIVKIPEPLTFANTGELKTRLRRLELYGTGQTHPARPRQQPRAHRNIIFDIHGVTSLDGSGAQVLEEIVRGYRERGVRVFFSRGPRRDQACFRLLERSGIVALVGGEDHFVADVQDALKLTEEGEGERGGGFRAVNDG